VAKKRPVALCDRLQLSLLPTYTTAICSISVTNMCVHTCVCVCVRAGGAAELEEKSNPFSVHAGQPCTTARILIGYLYIYKYTCISVCICTCMRMCLWTQGHEHGGHLGCWHSSMRDNHCRWDRYTMRDHRCRWDEQTLNRCTIIFWPPEAREVLLPKERHNH